MAARRLSVLIDKATNPRKQGGPDWKAVNQFSDQVIAAADGPLLALKAILPKLQSTTEAEALNALKTLDVCMKNCGKPFHQEVGKFKFLNELIKLVSPKYDAAKTPENVKKEIKIVLNKWARALPKEGKITQALHMLKRQGLVAESEAGEDVTQVAPRPRMAQFEDRNKAALLNRLLSSKHPEDLKAANRLIQEMVRQDEYKMDKVTRRLELLETARNNVKLLHELLVHYEPNQGHDIVKELNRSCEDLRPKLFKLAQEVADGDEGIGDVLHVSDDLNRVLEEYRSVVERGEKVFVAPPETQSRSSYSSVPTHSDGTAVASAPPVTPTGPSSALGVPDLDLLLDVGFGSAPPPAPASQAPGGASTSASLLDDELMALGLGPSEPVSQPSVQTSFAGRPSQGVGDLFGGGGGGGLNMGMPGSHPSPQLQHISPYAPQVQPSVLPQQLQQYPTLPPQVAQQPSMAGTADLLGGHSTGLNTLPSSQNPTTVQPPPSLLSQPAVIPQLQPPPQHQLVPPQDPLAVLDTLVVPLEAVKPGPHQPVKAYDKAGMGVVIHAGKDSPAPGVLVFVVSIMSMNPHPVTNVVFQAAVPKFMRVKLQPPSVTELPAYNPAMGGQAITQVMLIANPNKAKIRLKYKFGYAINGQDMSDIGEVSDFPVQ